MNVDYSLLHHFRVSQRRELALRGGLPAHFGRDGEELAGEELDDVLRAHLGSRSRAVVQLIHEDR